MRLMLISDGDIRNTKLIDPETNEAVEGLIAAEFSIGLEQMGELKVLIRGDFSAIVSTRPAPEDRDEPEPTEPPQRRETL